MDSPERVQKKQRGNQDLDKVDNELVMVQDGHLLEFEPHPPGSPGGSVGPDARDEILAEPVVAAIN
jgi:hypothetical protein